MMKIGNGQEVSEGATVWTTAKFPDEGWTLRKWTVDEGFDVKQVRLEPLGRGGVVIFVEVGMAFATMAEAREDRVEKIERELAQARAMMA